MHSFWRNVSRLHRRGASAGYAPSTNSTSYSNAFRGLSTSDCIPSKTGKIVQFARRVIDNRNLNEAGSHGFLKPPAWTSTLFRNMTTDVAHGKPPLDDDTVESRPIKFKRLDKTARHIMSILDKEEVEKVRSQREIPDIKPGYIIQLKVEVPENKSRVSVLKGIVIARRNAGLHSTFRLRRMVAGVGVESVFPLFSPNIKEMKVLDKKDVRRAKLYYLRDRMNSLKQHK